MGVGISCPIRYSEPVRIRVDGDLYGNCTEVYELQSWVPVKEKDQGLHCTTQGATPMSNITSGDPVLDCCS